MKQEYSRKLPKFYLFCEKCENDSMILISSEHNYSTGNTINIYMCEKCGFKKEKK